MAENKQIGRSPKIKLLRTVGFWKNKGCLLEHPFFPPLALGVLFARLKQNGYDVSQDDLSMRLHYDNFDKAGSRQFRDDLFFQEERIKQYVKSGSDNELESEIEKILEGVEDMEGIDIFLLSIPESLSNPSNILFAIAFSKFLKKRYSPQIVVGGHDFSLALLRTRYDISGIIDYIVIGEGEEAVIEIIDEIMSGKNNMNPQEVKVVRRPSGKIVIPDFSGLPFEKYMLSFLDYRDFSSNETLRDFFSSDTSMLLFQSIKGCPNTCAFCASSADPLGTFLSPEETVNALALLQERFNATGYLFMNDTINISRAYIERLCETISKKGINILWSACARVNGLDEEVIAKMRESGCIRLVIGMETASSGLLGRINKGISLADLENVLKLTSKYGIWTGIEVICGLPHETEDDINATIGFLANNREHIDKIYCNVFDLRSPSLMFSQPQVYGIENIREINLYREQDYENDSFNLTNIVRFSFDEINGLKWEDKKRQMTDSFWRVAKATNAHECLPTFLEEHFLFYMYSRLSEKKAIKRNYFDALKAFQDNPIE